jgi:hypothetical protein
MLEIASQLVVLAVALVVIFGILHAAFGQRYQFIVKIDQGEPRVTKGKVLAEFLDNIREVCREQGIMSGWVGGVKQGKAIALRFSRSIPPGCQQRLRNIWFSA